ncbi:MAG: hypothetical protein M1816_000717 [Peltula sp. TS41687]|nr:MAG: hypothetical protein M1816_000717 [Peltula sp. TS41687]
MPTTSSEIVALNWASTDINQVDSLGPVNWNALVQYAVDVKRRRDGINSPITCQLSSEYNMGGLNLVRRLHFQDGSWVARIQLHEHTPESTERLVREVYTMAMVRERSKIPVPEVYAYEANCDNPVEVPFIIMEFIPGNTAMDSFGGYDVHRGNTPLQFKARFHAAQADIQVQMSAIRFPKIGAIIKCRDGTYSVGPLPGIGGPFDSAAQFFEAWATKAKFPYMIDWEIAFIVPWEMVEFAKDVSIVPPAMDGPLYQEDEETRQRLKERREYIELARQAERTRGLDHCMSATLEDSGAQNFAHAIWLYEEGRIGFYADVIDQFEESRHHRR